MRWPYPYCSVRTALNPQQAPNLSPWQWWCAVMVRGMAFRPTAAPRRRAVVRLSGFVDLLDLRLRTSNSHLSQGRRGWEGDLGGAAIRSHSYGQDDQYSLGRSTTLCSADQP